jgi:hypothetical protein
MISASVGACFFPKGDVRVPTAPLHITPITLPRLHGLLGMGSSIRCQRPTHVHFLREVAFVVAADIPLVATVGLDQFSLRCHDGCSLQRIALTRNSLDEGGIVQQVDV